MTDAVGVDQTGEFISFMSGNTTRMGIAFGSADPARGFQLLIVVSLFVLGSALGAVVSRLSGRRRATGLLVYVGTSLALAAGLPAFKILPGVPGFERLHGLVPLARADMTLPSLVLILLAMGALNAVIESIAGVGLGLTYVTGSLAKIGRGLGNLAMGDRDLEWGILVGPLLGLVVGAAVGNALNRRFGRQTLYLPATICVSLGVAMLFSARISQKGKE